MPFRSNLVAFAGTLVLLSPMRAEQPFDFNSTPGKLPKQVVPQEYVIRIAPDVSKRTFTGSVTIKLDVRQPIRELVLNAVELQVTRASLDQKPLSKNALKLDSKQETLTIKLPHELPAGAHTLALQFSGKINTQGQGLYFAPYLEAGTGARQVMLGTQFEATDARRMFPCWDEPIFRARFQLTAIVPENLTAVSNMPVAEEKKTGRTKEVEFGMTPPMSSYLNVLCVGELDAIEKQSGSVLHRVVTTRGKAGTGRYALESAEQVVNFYNDYFGTPYPLPKLDEIAVPGGFGGAMENWGGITYFESTLLFDPARTSSDTKQRIYSVIAHEIAHQWFGNLVTMAWWDNLWLNEGFASWMGAKCTAKFNPDWEVWLQRETPRNPTRRVGIGKEAAMESDARSTTHPIQQPVATEADASSAFDEITYKKGQAFLQMLESFLGEEVFRAGIRGYMAKHKFSNTTTADLWNALGEASGKPVAEIAANWTEQPGFPIVTMARVADGKITLRQERFTVNFADAPPLQWKIPLTYKVAGSAAPVSLLLDRETTELSGIPPDRAMKLNVNGAGNFRVQYDEASWRLLLAELARLSVADRVNLLSDTWALVQANRVPLACYLELIEKLPGQTELPEQEQIMTAFEDINALLAGAPQRPLFQQYARAVLRPAFAAVGWEARPGESPKLVTLRRSLVVALGKLDDPDVIAGCRERFARLARDPASVSPDLRGAVLRVVGRHLDEASWEKLHELGRQAGTLEEKEEFYAALAAGTNPALIEPTLRLALTDELPSSRAVFLVPEVARASEHPELVWKFAQANMKALLAKNDALSVNSYAPGLFTFFSDPAMIAELQGYAKAHLPPAAAKAVEKAADEITFRAGFKQRLLEQSNSWSPVMPVRE